MSRVLIWKKLSPGSEYDIFRQTTIEEQNESILRSGAFNTGNRLWFQGIMSAINTKENEYCFLDDNLEYANINESFDFIILPMANIFNPRFCENLKSLAETFRKISVPTYVIACGAQAESYEKLNQLIKDVGKESVEFIDAIYSTGGEFALRGEFTKEFFNQLGFPSAVVTGCPSLYQFGEEFSIKTSESSGIIRPVFNGDIIAISEIMKYYGNSIYIDQDAMANYVIGRKTQRPSIKDCFAFYCNFVRYTENLIAEDRVRIIPDMYNWREFLIRQRFNYSFGSRIHGNIMSILSGIPATVIAIDTRTQEMAEFFKIPYIMHQKGKVYTTHEFEEIYKQCDYTQFNEHYTLNYNRYKRFLTDHGIVKNPCQGNVFFQEKKKYTEPVCCQSKEYCSVVSDIISHNHLLFQLLRKIKFGD